MKKQNSLILNLAILLILIFSALPVQPAAAAAPAPENVYTNGLKISPVTAYNLVVDSNVLSPASYGPNAATVGAKFCNTTGSTMNNVFAYIGTYTNSTTQSPGIYPRRTNIAENTGLNAATATDFGGPVFSLKHEGGSAGTTDATRYIGTLDAGECSTVYWLISYPRKALVGGSWIDVTGGSKPEDDLWLEYDLWGTYQGASSSDPYAYYKGYLTMRNEISAMANKIWPNGDNKVPDEYISAIQKVVGWDTWTPNGSGTTAYPGETVTSQGIWYDLGNVGAGFDNNGDLIPDRNAWVQPIGDATTYDPGCFRLVRSYGLIIIKLTDGTEQLIPFVDQMYFENIPDNNNGAVGLVYYEYVALDGACTAGLTPYQEVASGYDNEKFNADFGAGIPPLTSQQSKMTLAKTATGSVAPGAVVSYSVTFTLPDASQNQNPATTITVGNPALGMPLVFEDTIPAGMAFRAAAGEVSNIVTMSSGYSPATMTAALMYSTNSGATWSSTPPADGTLSSSPDNLIKIQWWLPEPVYQNTNGAGSVTGTVTFNATAPSTNPPPSVTNTACLKFGNGPCFTDASASTLVTGPNSLNGYVFQDDGTGTMANGVRDTGEAGIYGTNGVTVNLYLWNDADGDNVVDSGEVGTTPVATTQTSNATPGYYSFSNLPDGKYVVQVDTGDSDLTASPRVGYSATTPILRTANLDAGHASGSAVTVNNLDFGFAPIYSLTKKLISTSPAYEGDSLTYELTASNLLPGSGTGSSTCQYYVWANTINYTDLAGMIPPGGNSANARFQDYANAAGRPEGKNAYTIMSNTADLLGLSGFNIGQMSGNITKVYYVVEISERVDFLTNDYVEVRVWDNSGGTLSQATVDTYNQTNTFSALSIGTPYEIKKELGYATYFPTQTRWEWSNFANNSMALQIYANGGNPSGDINLDAAGFLIETDGTCGSSSTTLNPVPVTDQFDNRYLEFVSAVPPISGAPSVSGNDTTLTWSNVGPLYPGQSKTITVSFKAKNVTSSTSTINQAQTLNAKFASGASANDDLYATNQAPVTINPLGSISGYTWNEVNNIGWQGTGSTATGYDSSDDFIPGVTLTLYACYSDAPANGGTLITTPNTSRDCNAQSNPANWYAVPNATAVTDASGYYKFSNLRPGYYYVQITGGTPSNQTAYARQNAANNGVSGTSLIWQSAGGNVTTDNLTTANFNNLAEGEDITNVNFGFNSGPMIFGNIWQDYNGDGVRDALDSGLDNGASGVTVSIYNCGADAGCTSSTLVSTVNTDASGYYQLNSGLSAGNYYRVVVNTGSLPAGSWTNTDEDAPTGSTGVVAQGSAGDSVIITPMLTTGVTSGGYDFGYTQKATSSIGDTLFYDWNGDALQTAGVDEGIKNVTVYLYRDLDSDGVIDPNEPLVSTTTSNDNGLYCFIKPGTVTVPGDVAATATACPAPSTDTGLPAGNYIVKVDTSDGDFPAATTSETKDPSESGMCVTCDSKSSSIPLTGSDANLDQDFGYKPTGTGTIGDTIFKDMNGDGIQSGTETGISGITVNLKVDLNGDGTYVTIATQTTDSSGKYLFTGLPAGVYRIEVDQTANTSAIPNDPFGSDYIPSYYGGTSGTTIYWSKTLDTNTSNDLTADFAFAPSASIGDTVYQDTNGNGTQDLNEPGINGVTVNLYTFTDSNANNRYDPGESLSGSPAATTTTAHDASSGQDGVYRFTGLTPGYYVVVVDDTDTELTNATLTGDPNLDGAPCNGESVCDHREGMRLYNGTNYAGADFGYQLPGAFGDSLWIDTNNNQVRDLGEYGIPNVQVTASTSDPVYINGTYYPSGVSLTTVTDANGNYFFENIAPSGGNITWSVTVNTNTADPQYPFPSGLTNTSDPDDPDGNGLPAHDSATTVVMNASGTVTSVGVLADADDDGDASDALGLDADFGYRFSGNTAISGTICLETGADGYCGDSNTDSSGVSTSQSAYADVVVYLYRLNDTDNDGVLDAGETTTLVGTTTTNAAGDYTFSNITDGLTYVVAIGAPRSGLDLTSTSSIVNSGGDGTQTSSFIETNASNTDVVTTYQVIQATSTSIVDRDFTFKLNGNYDFGDLPESYSTTLQGTPDGARHLQPSGGFTRWLGTTVTDTEANGTAAAPDTSPNGDDSNGADEDGVLLPSTAAENIDGWNDGEGVLQFDIVGSGWLVGWIDYNRDGDFADSGEMVISREIAASVTNQDYTITTPTTAAAISGYFYARFRLFASQPPIPALAYAGATTDGDVEDYRFYFDPTAVTLADFRATIAPAQITLQWETAMELNTVGFNLYRSTNPDGERVQINNELILPQSSGGIIGGLYKFIDTNIQVDQEYFYWLEFIDTGGSEMFGPVSAIVTTPVETPAEPGVPQGHGLFLPVITK